MAVDQPGTDGLTAFAQQLNAHLEAGDYQFLYNRILPTHVTCSNAFVNVTGEKPLTCQYVNQQLDVVPYVDAEDRFEAPSDMIQILAGLFTNADTAASDSFGTGALRAYGAIASPAYYPSSPADPYSSLDPQAGPALVVTAGANCPTQDTSCMQGQSTLRLGLETYWIYMGGRWKVDGFFLATVTMSFEGLAKMATPLAPASRHG